MKFMNRKRNVRGHKIPVLNQIPASVTQEDLTRVLEPLLDLLGVSRGHVYLSPPITIGHDHISFVVPATHREHWKTPRPAARRPDFHPQDFAGAKFAEMGLAIRVEVDVP